jgi:hypothetical protein
MSFAGQVLWNRKTVALWAFATIGADTAPAASAAPFSSERRGFLISLIEVSPESMRVVWPTGHRSQHYRSSAVPPQSLCANETQRGLGDERRRPIEEEPRSGSVGETHDAFGPAPGAG